MPYQIEWLVPDRIILSLVTDPFDVAETPEFDGRGVELLDSSSAEKVHVIALDMNTQVIPLSTIVKMKYPQHPKLHWVVNLKTPNPVMRMIFTFGAQFFGVRLRFVESFEEALTFLQDIDSTLPNLEPFKTYLADKNLG